MAVMARESWTDERLDDLNHRVDEGFRDMREEFRALRGGMRTESQALRAEIGAMHRSMNQIAFAAFGAMLVGFLGTITAIVTQL
ncbi:MAG: hypothetical protein JJE35_02265 [Thermoleophilia bacterium]|nr:hypothetical protein [Thermoleophilia bacterium]